MRSHPRPAAGIARPAWNKNRTVLSHEHRHVTQWVATASFFLSKANNYPQIALICEDRPFSHCITMRIH
jgi:hypothetical protein